MLNAPGAGWNLAFDDEFNGTSLDTTKWANYLPWTNSSTGNNQWEGGSYLDYMVNANTTISGVNLTSNLSVSGGELHLKTQQVSSFTVGSQSFTYTGAMITTGINPYRTFSSGYFEIRARVPQGAGNWPAFWMTNGWPPEDDIMEYKPSGGPWNHQGLYGMDQVWHDHTTTGSSVPSTNWHTYAMEWGPGFQNFYIDDALTYSTTTGIPTSANPEYLLLNSGIYSGQQGSYSNSNDNTLDVDYVRIYNYTAAASPTIANAGFNTTGSWSFTNSNAYIVNGSTIGQTGTGDLHIVGSGEAYQTITGLSPNTTYTLTASGEIGTTGSSAQGLLGVNSYGGADTSVPIGGQLAWGTASVTFTTGASNTSAVIYCDNPNSNNVYFDDLSLVMPAVLSSVSNTTTPISTAKTVSFSVTNGSASSNWSLSDSSSNTILVPTSGLSLGGTGSSRTLTITPTSGQTGTTTITVTATDVLGGLYTDTFNLTVANSVTINGDQAGSGQNDLFRLVRSGTQVNLYQNSTTPTQQFNYSSGNALIINGLTGNNQLVLDYSGGDPIMAGGLSFNGGTGTNTLSVTNMSGGTSATISSGSLSLGSDAISFTNTQTLALDLGSGSNTLTSTTAALGSVLNLTVDVGSTTTLAASSTLPTNSILNITGTFNLNNQNQTIDQITGTGTFNLGSGTITAGAAGGSSAFAGSIIGSGGLTKWGVGTLVLSGHNSFTGPVNLGGGATSGGNVDGILQITTAAALAGVTQMYFNDNNSAYAGFQINNTSGLPLVLPASLSYTLDANSAGAGVAATIIDSLAGTNTIAGAMSFTVGGLGYGISVDAGSLTFSGAQSATSHVMYLRGAGSGAFSVALTGTASIFTSGPGTWTLNGANSYSGYTNVAGGTLTVAATGSITSTNINALAGGYLNLLGTVPAASVISANGTVNFGSPTTNAILVRKVANLSIGSGGLVTIANAADHRYRTLFVPAVLTDTSGTLDLANNDMDLAGTTLANIQPLLALGYNGGNWNGSGIISSTAATDTTRLHTLGVLLNSNSIAFDGTNPSASDVLIKYTYYGDANLDGQVDGSDYSMIDNGVLQGQTNWSNGNFNYDSVLNGSDYTLIDNAYNTQGGNLNATAQIATPTAVRFVPPAWTPSNTPITLDEENSLSARRKHPLLPTEPA